MTNYVLTRVDGTVNFNWGTVCKRAKRGEEYEGKREQRRQGKGEEPKLKRSRKSRGKGVARGSGTY